MQSLLYLQWDMEMNGSDSFIRSGGSYDPYKMQAIEATLGIKRNTTDKQFGKKIGKHAQDYGLNPYNPNDRNIMRNIIENIHSNKSEVRQGSWMGLGEKLPNGNRADGTALFYRKGNDVVVTDTRGNFVTILKDGATQNTRFRSSTIIWINK